MCYRNKSNDLTWWKICQRNCTITHSRDEGISLCGAIKWPHMRTEQMKGHVWNVKFVSFFTGAALLAKVTYNNSFFRFSGSAFPCFSNKTSDNIMKIFTKQNGAKLKVDLIHLLIYSIFACSSVVSKLKVNWFDYTALSLHLTRK